MSNNPFTSQFDSTCNSCGEKIQEGDQVYATPDGFLCPDCAEAGDYVCYCGNFKKANYDECYECFTNSKEKLEEDEYGEDREIFD